MSHLLGNLASPPIIDWHLTEMHGAILSENIGGDVISKSFASFSEGRSLQKFVAEYLSLASVLGDHQPPLYHNDMSAHNIYALPAGGVRVVDFEQATDRPISDPFAIMLWTIFDIASNDAVSYRKDVYKSKLRLPVGALRVGRGNYPAFETLSMPEWFVEFYSDAMNSNDWFSFANKWKQRVLVSKQPG